LSARSDVVLKRRMILATTKNNYFLTIVIGFIHK
jgi:hypothetical protein